MKLYSGTPIFFWSIYWSFEAIHVKTSTFLVVIMWHARQMVWWYLTDCLMRFSDNPMVRSTILLDILLWGMVRWYRTGWCYGILQGKDVSMGGSNGPMGRFFNVVHVDIFSSCLTLIPLIFDRYSNESNINRFLARHDT